MAFILLYTSWLLRFSALRVPPGYRNILQSLGAGSAHPSGPARGEGHEQREYRGQDGGAVRAAYHRANGGPSGEPCREDASNVDGHARHEHIQEAPVRALSVGGALEQLGGLARLIAVGVHTGQYRRPSRIPAQIGSHPARESHRTDSGAGQHAGVAGSRVAGGHRVATRSALDAVRRRSDSGASGRRLVGHHRRYGPASTPGL